MRISTIKIKNFKGISSLEFNPKRINLIIGKNNTGKTSLIEAINLLFNPNETNRLYPNHLQNIIKSGSEHSELFVTANNKKIDLKIKKADELETIYAFKNDLIDSLVKNLSNTKYSTEIIKAIKDELEKELTELIDPELKSMLIKDSITLFKDENEKKVYYSLKHPLYQLTLSKLESIYDKILKHLKNRLDLEEDVIGFKFLRYALYYALHDLAITQISDKKDVVLIKNLIQGIERNISIEKNEKAVERIHEIELIIKEHNLIGGLERLDSSTLFKSSGDGQIVSVPFSFLGDGFKALVGLLWRISSKDMNNKIVLLDEPEIHMHPGYILELIKFILKFSKEFGIQFFIVTHNIDFIDFLFSGNFLKEEQEYLEKELLILGMGKLKDSTISKALNYKEAKDTRDQLLLDLRGV